MPEMSPEAIRSMIPPSCSAETGLWPTPLSASLFSRPELVDHPVRGRLAVAPVGDLLEEGGVLHIGRQDGGVVFVMP